MLKLITNPLIRALSAALIAAALLGAAYIAGSRNAKQAAKLQALEDFKATMERINEEGVDITDPDAVHRELCRAAGLAECPVRRDSGQASDSRGGTSD